MRRLRNGGDVDGASAVRLATTAGRGDRAAPRRRAAAVRAAVVPVLQQDPGRAQQQPEEQQAGAQETGIKPDFNRNREELEGFPLDSLRMVGTLEREDNFWAIVLATDATIHRVQVGNYMGQNHGKIVDILEGRVELVEIARDARGRWEERPAAIALIEEE